VFAAVNIFKITQGCHLTAIGMPPLIAGLFFKTLMMILQVFGYRTGDQKFVTAGVNFN
jgi:hypothetical protein